MINTNPVTLHYIHRQRHFSQFIDKTTNREDAT